MPYTSTNPAHPKNPKRQLVQLHASHPATHALPFLNWISRVTKCAPGPQQLKHVAENEIADRPRVGVGRVNHLNTTATTRGHVDVFQSNPAAPDHAKLWGLVEQSVG